MREGEKEIEELESRGLKLNCQLTSVGEDMEKSEFSCTAGGHVKWFSHFIRKTA